MYEAIKGIITDIALFLQDFADKLSRFIAGISSKDWYNDETIKNID